MSLPALDGNPKIILFTDWDGTVTLEDSNDFMTDNYGFGIQERRRLNEEIIDGKISFRKAFSLMMESVKVPFDRCIEILLKNVKLDPGFADFFRWTQQQSPPVPVVVVSSGMEPIIRALLTKLVGEEAAQKTQIISNSVDIHADGQWDIVFRDESDFGHDKSRAIRPYASLAKRPILLYAGDGVSDLSAAKETDLLFAKEGRDLVTWCRRENVPFHEFKTYEDIHSMIQRLYDGEVTLESLREK